MSETVPYGEDAKQDAITDVMMAGMHWAYAQMDQGQSTPDEGVPDWVLEAWREGYDGSQWPEVSGDPEV